ncbi:uncharacterized protein LOC106666516 [Cimex lectularius]|uniref:CUB domain-containing protein n=1 Tax=Cimex lectularius TaxID=79782 RepID=A0A8I6RQH7_CIMLE|nr:uncharacterized protein LOC106666516 [Cimex lectularius]
MDMKAVVKTSLIFLILAYISWITAAQEGSSFLSSRLSQRDSQFRTSSSGVKIKRRKIKRPTQFKTGPSSDFKTSTKDSRFLSLFTVVQFGNDGCQASTGDNGTCMTSAECSARGGVANGPCAKTFGVCCLFMSTCGQTTSQNCTYFVNPGYPTAYDGTGSCQLTIQKAHPDVCQYRIDFDQFTLAGPEPVNNVCNNDQFIVSGGNPVPGICGMNNGNHMYIDAGTGVNNPVTLTVVTSGPTFARNWKMKICQIPCSSNYRAEEGCLQYYTGVSGQIKSFNFDPTGGLQLSNQDYSACVRIERNFCGIQYTACADNMGNRTHAFTMSGNTMSQNPTTSMIGGLGPTACSGDWVIIPCAMNVGRSPSSPPVCVDRICGGTFNSEVSTTQATVYSTVKPFRLVVHTDNVEAPNDIGNKGFCLNYVQQPCTNKLN